LSFFNEYSPKILCQEKTARHAIEQFITRIYRKPHLAHIKDKTREERKVQLMTLQTSERGIALGFANITLLCSGSVRDSFDFSVNILLLLFCYALKI
jgi:hypothetical protein